MTEPSPRPAPPPGAPRADAAPVGSELADALARLDGLAALPVHDHVAVFEDVDRALRHRLTSAEG